MKLPITAGVPVTPVNSTTLVNNTAKDINLQVPAGRFWRLHFVAQSNGDNVQRECIMGIYKPDGTLIYTFWDSNLAANAWAYIPNSTYPVQDLVLDSYWYLRFRWLAGGASAGGTAYYNILAEQWAKIDPIYGE